MATTPSSPDQDAIHTHLNLLQGVIQRMSSNSANCKTWCITLVSAILVVLADRSTNANPNLAWLALIPTLLFGGLDTYYLALEKNFRDSYKAFVDNLHALKITHSDLYQIGVVQENLLGDFCLSLKSFSIWPFYGVLVITIGLAKCFLLDS